MTWQPRDFGMFSAMLPTSLRVLDHKKGGRVSLPDLGHLTALTELRFDLTILKGGGLPHLPALRLLVATAFYMVQPNDLIVPGPHDLGLADATPLLSELHLSLGFMVAPHDQLACLASLAQLKTLVLDFNGYEDAPPENLLRPTTLLSLPSSVTKLVLCDFERCVPAVLLPEGIDLRFESSF